MSELEEGQTAQEHVIPYATPARPIITARDVFGIVVRTCGLAVAFWGLYTVYYLCSAAAISMPMGNYSQASMSTFAAFLLLVGVALLKGEWLVRFAYGPVSN